MYVTGLDDFKIYEIAMDLWAEKNIDIYNSMYNDNPILDYTKVRWLDRIIYKLKEWRRKK